MKLTIHRGTREIGGSCVELITQHARILIDCGLPLTRERLSARDKKKILPQVQGLYETPEFDAVLISHAHPDHYGLLSFVHPDIPLYMSKGTKALIDVSFTFNQSDFQPKNTKIIAPWKIVEIKDVRITPFLVDHSGFDALAFLIDAEGKRIFYSGDFRGHGRKKILFEKILAHPVADVDYLLMEGTMLSREHEPYVREEEIEAEMVRLLAKSGNLIFLACSSQNIDRLVSAYKACMRTDTLFVVDPYTAYVLYALRDISPGLPQYDWGKHMRIFFIPNRYTDTVLNKKHMFCFKEAKITKEEVFSLADKMLIKDSYLMRNIFKNKKLLAGTTVIYSQWEGYLDQVKDFWERNDVRIIHCHASGHAYRDDLVKCAHALKPKNIIPIHTEKAERYKEMFDAPVVLLEDGEKFEC